MQLIFEINGINMKLKLLIALVAVPSLVMAQANLPSSASVGSTGNSAGGVPTPHQPTLTELNPNKATGQPGANQQQTATNPSGTSGSSSGKSTSTNVGGIYVDFDSSGKTTSTTPANVGGKVDGHGSSNKATVKGSSQGSTFTNPCSSARTCN